MPAKIMNSKDLNLFLRILAEESVKKAYTSELSSSRPLFEKGEDDEEEGDDPLFGGGDDEGDDPLFGGGDDEGDDDGADVDVDVDAGGGGGDEGDDPLADLAGGGDDEEGGDVVAAPEEKPEKQQRQVRPTPLTLELGEVTTDGLISTLNMIRGGRSFKEPDIGSELQKYIEKQLSDSERLALATFLSALKDITSGTPAEDAPDPGDENVSINATDKERRQNRDDDAQRHPSKPALQPSYGQKAPRGLEDTSPPISVGPRNSRLAEEYRQHILSVLIG